MILPEHLPYFELIRRTGAYQSPFLMLGNQECRIEGTPQEFFEVDDYTTLDPDGGDIQADLTQWVPDRQYNTVFNLGTIEHIWDVHRAFCTAISAVAIGGYFVHHAPAGGYEGHGIHVTDWYTVRDFFKLNGFEVRQIWFSDQQGGEISVPMRDKGQQIFWMVAQKIEEVSEYTAPQQTFSAGRKT